MCEYKTSQKKDLRTHVETTHVERRHKCDMCEYKTSQKEDLRKPVETTHVKHVIHLYDVTM